MTPDALLDSAPPDTEEPQIPDYGPDNAELPEQLVEAIRATIVDFNSQEKYSRRREVLNDRKLRFYERGFQHISFNNSTGAFTLATPGAMITNQAGQSVQCPSYIDDYDIFFPFLRILMAILTQNPPGINFLPEDPSIS